jgi:hypothetical protein
MTRYTQNLGATVPLMGQLHLEINVDAES